MWLGITIALVGHLATVAAGTVYGVLLGGDDAGAVFGGLVAGLIGQVVLFVACLVAGIVLNQRGDRSLGNGLIIGWAVGLLVAPVVGFGVCVLALRRAGGAL
jgi:hypothetical protein